MRDELSVTTADPSLSGQPVASEAIMGQPLSVRSDPISLALDSLAVNTASAASQPGGAELLDRLPPEQQETLSRLLEEYLADLEQGVRRDPESLIEANPELAEPLRWYLGSLDFLHVATNDLGATEADHELAQQTLHELGDYQIVREIGRGGMGVVYEARQKSLGRKVALKVLPFAAVLDQRQIVRFQNEAQAAAQLHHPHIVPVHSVGCDRGVHYYSMQLIDGLSLDQAIYQLQQIGEDPTAQCDADADTNPNIAFSTQRSVSSRGHVRSVVELVRQAASALQHAHEFGVVHRDIKPSNLLVDQQGKLWVTDFGLARCQNSTTITMTGDLVGTIRYMSPEAAAGRGHLVDHLSDVYSLGVSLYEMLTLHAPHPATERGALLDQVIHHEPLSPRKHNPSIPLDLETIVLKAIEKRRDDRYESAAALENDLQRFLDGQSPVATRPTIMDRIGKWAARHRAVVAFVGLVLLVSTLAAGAAAMMISSEKRKTDAALKTAESNLQQSKLNLNKAIEVVDRFGMRLAGQLSGVPGAEQLRQTILQETLVDYQEFAEQMEGDDSMRYALALCHTQMASMLRGLGQFPESMQRYADAVELYKRLIEEGQDDESVDVIRVRQDLATCRNNWGELSFRRGQLEQSESHYSKGLAIAEQLLIEDSDDETSQHLLTATLVNFGSLKIATHDYPEALEIYERAVITQKQLCDRVPDSQLYQRELAVSYAQLSFLLTNTDLDRATKYNELATEIHQRLVDGDTGDVAALSELATCYNHRGAIYRQRGQLDDARLAYEDAIQVQERLVARAPTVVRYQEQLAVGYNNVGQIIASGIKPDAGESSYEIAFESFERARKILARLVVIAPESPHYRAQLGGVLTNLAPLLEDSNAHSAASYYQQAVDLQEWALGRSPRIKDFRVWLSSTYEKYSRFLIREKQYDDAGEIGLRHRGLWRDHPTRLYLIAREFTKVASQSKNPQWADAARETVELAVKAGLELSSDEPVDPVLQVVSPQPKSEPLAK